MNQAEKSLRKHPKDHLLNNIETIIPKLCKAVISFRVMIDFILITSKFNNIIKGDDLVTYPFTIGTCLIISERILILLFNMFYNIFKTTIRTNFIKPI